MTRITTHPGEILLEEFMIPMAMNARTLAAALHVPPNRITAIVHGNRSITADTAIRLGIHFDTSAEFWTNLQTAHDLSKAAAEKNDYSSIATRAAVA